ncbi:MAG: hypothetical protein KKB50_09130 [Planctomycetes bacterium]|nr:hypothetical protein [Planctomycetota bacterium]
MTAEHNKTNDADLECLLERYADGLSDAELQMVVPAELRERLRNHIGREVHETSAILRWAPWVLAPAACLALIAFLLTQWGPPLTIERMVITPERVRAPSNQPGELLLSLELSSPAHIRVVVFDARHEGRLVPLDDAGQEFVRRIELAYNLRFDGASRQTDAGGAAKVLFVMVVASPGPSPSTEELLQSIPERVAPRTEDRGEIAQALKQLARQLESRFNCTTRVTPVPAE